MHVSLEKTTIVTLAEFWQKFNFFQPIIYFDTLRNHKYVSFIYFLNVAQATILQT